MQTKIQLIAFCAIIALFLFAGKANVGIKIPIQDTVCCSPDSLKVVSTNYPIFCVSWRIPLDSGCRIPYGFGIQWRPIGGHFWREKIKEFVFGTTQTFCDTVTACVPHEWRVRTICIVDGVTTYSDWIYGPNITFNCTSDFEKKKDVGFIHKDSSDSTSMLNLANTSLIKAQNKLRRPREFNDNTRMILDL